MNSAPEIYLEVWMYTSVYTYRSPRREGRGRNIGRKLSHFDEKH